MGRSILSVCLSILCLLMAIAGRAQAEERLALVVGNSAYASVQVLDNPSNDAALVAATLEQMGFQVTLLLDANQVTMKRGIAQFGRALRRAGPEATGLFYYAGHGVQSFGNNYLLPTDVALADAADLDLMAVEAQSVLRQMASARNRTNIMILDACRNNPFSNIPDLNDNGLAEMKAPTGTFLAYATAPGAVALDGVSDNSPYTHALVQQIQVPGVPIEQAFKQVRRDVLAASRGMQTPWDTSSLVSDFVFASAPEPSVQADASDSLWQAVRQARDPMQLTLFLRSYPDGPHAAEAQALLVELMNEQLAEGQSQETAEAEEEVLFDQALQQGTRAGWEAYLARYPAGRYTEAALAELAQLIVATAEALPERAGEAVPTDTPRASLQFDTPLVSDLPQVNGLSLAELVENSPAFPPIEGLPEAYWKEATCSSCHNWTRDSLCKQGGGYVNLSMMRSLTKKHPFGGSLKTALRDWSLSGCK